VSNPDEVAVDEELWHGLPTQVDLIPDVDPFGLGPYPQPGDWAAAYARMVKLQHAVEMLNDWLVSEQRKRRQESAAAAREKAHLERRIAGMERELRWRAAPDPCDNGSPCLGSGCSHQRAADELVRLGQDNPTDGAA
jgi:hypothetical protein